MENRYTSSKLFSQTDCPDQETLIRYVEGKLMPAMTHQVENHLLDCGLCSDTVDTLNHMGVPAFRLAMAKVTAKVSPAQSGQAGPKPEATVVPLRPRKTWMYGIAASVALVVVATFLLMGGGGQGDIEILTMHEPMPYEATRSENQDEKLYNSGDFLGAARTSQDQALKGIAYAYAGKPDSAEHFLEPLVGNDTHTCYQQILWAYASSQEALGHHAEALDAARNAFKHGQTENNPVVDPAKAQKYIKQLEKKAAR